MVERVMVYGRELVKSCSRGVLVVAAGLTFASASNAETLEDALVSTYQTNPTLKAERANLRATDEQVNQARAGWRPTITVRGRYTSQEVVSKSPNFQFSPTDPAYSKYVTKNEPFSGSATLSQPVFSGGQTIFATKRAKALVGAGRANLIAVEQQVLLDAATAYLDVIRDEAVVKLSNSNVAVLERQYKAAQDRFAVGEITRTDVAQSQARLEGARSNLIASEAGLTASLAAFRKIVGREPIGSLVMPELPPLPVDEAEFLRLALQTNPGLQSARSSEQANKAGVNFAKGALLPQISIEATLSHSEDTAGANQFSSGGGNQSDSTSVAGVVSIPLYQGGATYSRIREAKQQHSRSRIRIAETERAVEEAAIRSWDALRSARAMIVSGEEQVRAAKIAFEGVQQEAMVGSRTTLDVLDAEQEHLDAQVALVRARRDEFVAAYQLLSITGQLTAGELGLKTEVYDPGVNYRKVQDKLFGTGTYSE